MSRFWLAIAANLLAGGVLFAAEVQVQVKPSPTKAPPSSGGKSPSPTATVNQQLPQYRPAVLGLGPDSVINRMDTATLIKNGQKDGSLLFCCSVGKGGRSVIPGPIACRRARNLSSGNWSAASTSRVSFPPFMRFATGNRSSAA